MYMVNIYVAHVSEVLEQTKFPTKDLWSYSDD